MTEEADAGDMIAQRPVEITFEDTALTLFRKVAQAALALFRETFPLIKAGLAPRIPQDPARATYYGGRRPEDGEIEWVRPALALYNLIRAVTAPYPGAFTGYQGQKLYVWSSRPAASSGEDRCIPGTMLGVRDRGCLVATGQGHLLLTQVQRQGEEMLSGEAFMDRYGLSIGDRLGED
jgi:methionyl-tRNA formyltransferase